MIGRRSQLIRALRLVSLFLAMLTSHGSPTSIVEGLFRVHIGGHHHYVTGLLNLFFGTRTGVRMMGVVRFTD